MGKTTARNINLIITIVFFLMCGFILYYHENWRDEAQAWLLASELSPAELIAQMKYEGHPCLWHFILMPFAKSGFPYVTTNLISIFFVTIAVALLLWKAPLNMALKLVLVFGSALSYFYGVISRSYCLIPVFLFLSAIYYRDRHIKPIRYGFCIALLVQTHIIMLPTAGLMSLFFLAEAIKTYMADRNTVSLLKKGAGLFLPFISLIFLLVQVGGATESSAFSINLSSFASFLDSFVWTCLKYWTRRKYEKKALWFAAILCIACAVCVFYAIVVSIRRKDKEAIKAIAIVCLSILCQLVFSVIVYPLNNQRYFIFYFIWVWLIWVLWPIKEKRNCFSPLVAVFLLMSLVSYQGHVFCFFDIKGCYSGSKECAYFINTYIPTDALILQSDTSRFSAVVPYLDENYQVFSFETGKADTFTTWKSTVPVMETIDDATRWVKENHADASEYWVIIPENGTLHQWFLGPGKSWLEFENYSSLNRLGDEAYAICRIDVV